MNILLIISLLVVCVISIIICFIIINTCRHNASQVCQRHVCECFGHNNKWICFPSCKKLLDILLVGINSFNNFNKNINFVVFNNNELNQDDITQIKHQIDYSNKLYIVDISPWMDIFKDCKPLHGQHNNYIRLLMPLVFQKHFPNVNRFMYCDEDCYCIGDINTIYNIDFNEQFAGVIDIIPIINEKNHFSYKQIDYQFVDKWQYINSGLMLFKTSFDIRKLIPMLNMIIIFNLLLGPDSDRICHDQFVLNLYPHSMVPLTISDDFKKEYADDTLAKELIKQCFVDYNVAHTYGYKNDVDELIKDNLI